MNRDTKFRAWDKNNQCWLTDKESVYLNEDGDAYILVRGAASDFLSSVDVNIVWFTGLKDKNGVDIYEGDIVMTDSSALMKVCYRDDMCRFVLRFNDHSASSDLHNDLEVKGNIYENSELLNQSL